MQVAPQANIDGALKLLAVRIVSGVQKTDGNQEVDFVERSHLAFCPSLSIFDLFHASNSILLFLIFHRSQIRSLYNPDRTPIEE